MERWTIEDEIQLTKLMERKTKILETNMTPLFDIVRVKDMERMDCNEIAECLAANADSFRDFLFPFDSGVRIKGE
jgi:hypothetical protein